MRVKLNYQYIIYIYIYKTKQKTHLRATTKYVYYNKKNRYNNIEVMVIVYAKCCNKI